jgi:uncharacterized membrane protein
MKKNKWTKILFWFLAVLPFLISAGFYSHLPEQVATHFDSLGAANGYSSREVAAFGLPAFYLVIILVIIVTMKIDPRSKNIEQSVQLRTAVLWGLVLLFNLSHTAILLNAVNVRVNISIITGIAVGLLFLVIGNYLPKCRPNYTMGIKLPWTLASEDNWRKTHRFAGPLWIIGGVLIMLSAFFASVWGIVVTVVLVLLLTAPAVYSYLLFRREQGNRP